MMRKRFLEEAGYTVDDIKSMDDLGEVYAAVYEKHPM